MGPGPSCSSENFVLWIDSALRMNGADEWEDTCECVSVFLEVSFVEKQICKNDHRFYKNKSFYGCISVVFVADVFGCRAF